MGVLEMHWNVRVKEYDQANNKPPAFYKYLCGTSPFPVGRGSGVLLPVG